MIGRRRPATQHGRLPDDIRAGDYWKILDKAGKPKQSDEPSNLTGTCWYVAAPIGDERGFAIGNLTKHTVREHEDGTISVRPGDGSSNSILITGSRGRSWHGYIEHGVWSEAKVGPPVPGWTTSLEGDLDTISLGRTFSVESVRRAAGEEL